MKNRINLTSGFFHYSSFTWSFCLQHGKRKINKSKYPKTKVVAFKKLPINFSMLRFEFFSPFSKCRQSIFAEKSEIREKWKKGRNMCNAAYRSFTDDLFTNPMLSRVKYRTSYRFLLSWLYKRVKYRLANSHNFSFLVEKI